MYGTNATADVPKSAWHMRQSRISTRRRVLGESVSQLPSLVTEDESDSPLSPIIVEGESTASNHSRAQRTRRQFAQ